MIQQPPAIGPCEFYRFDPFEHIPRERATVGALRSLAADVDTTPRPLAAEETQTPLTTAAVSLPGVLMPPA